MYSTCVERSVCVITALYLFTLRCNQRTSHAAGAAASVREDGCSMPPLPRHG